MSYGSGLPREIPRLTWQYSRQVEKVVVRYGSPPSVVVDLGAGGRRLAPHVHTVDFAALPGTDIIADVCATPFDDRTVDLVIATGLLEHVLDERKLLDECRRILKPGGVLHVELPFLQQYHDDPIDCRRYTVPGLARLLEQHGFQVSEFGPPHRTDCNNDDIIGVLYGARIRWPNPASKIGIEFGIRNGPRGRLAAEVSRSLASAQAQRTPPRVRRLLYGLQWDCSFRFNRAGLSDVKLGVIPPVSTVTEVTARRCSPWGFCRRSTTTKATA